MAASLKFYGGTGGQLIDIDSGGSGIGFFGSSGFGTSVGVGLYQDSTYITNSAGSQQGPQVTNIKHIHTNSGSVDGTPLPLSGIPNDKCTFNMRFTYDSAVIVSNAKIYIYDRNNINNNPSGVTAKLAELMKPNLTNNEPWGSGSQSWSTIAGSSSIHTCLGISPGISGIAARGQSKSDARHDWYFALSCSPNSIGSKLFALYASLEYS